MSTREHLLLEWDLAPCQKWAKSEGFVACPKTMAGVGHLKRICKDAFSVAGAVQETCSSEMLGGPGAYFLRGIAFWSIRSSGLLRWFCVTGATLRMAWHHFFWQGQHFKHMDWKKYKTHWHEAVSSALNFPWLTEVSQNCFVFDAANFKLQEVSQNCFVFDAANFKLQEVSHCFVFDAANFKIQEVSQNYFVFIVIKFKSWGSLAE